MNSQVLTNLSYWTVTGFYLNTEKGNTGDFTYRNDEGYSAWCSGYSVQNFGPIKKGQYVVARIKDDIVTFEYSSTLRNFRITDKDKETVDNFHKKLTGKHIMKFSLPALEAR